jgi:hypothetical protein
VADIEDIPIGKILLAGFGISKHSSHVSHIGNVPAQNVLVERISALKHGTHVCDI